MPRPAVETVRAPDRVVAMLGRSRRELLAHLGEPDSAAGLSRKLGVPRQRINYHLRELEKQGFVELVEERRKGNCTERVVRATARTFVISPEALGVLGTTPGLAADRFSAAYLLSAAAQTIREVATLDARARASSKRIATFTLETEIRFADAASRAQFAEELAHAVARLTSKYHDEKARGGRRFRFLTAVHPKEGTHHE
jgi:DNA-binding transcriptional ArsR family regulator